MSAGPHDLDSLLAHAGWARALARSLVSGDDRADDLVQRAWLAALRRPPQDGVPPRRWLAAVLRNLARDDAREAERRGARERAAARHERVETELAAEAQARLLAAVRELPPSLRASVWARYYEGLPPRAIAARDGLPVATVKTRLARGLEALRARLDREHDGDRATWVALFLPLTQARHSEAFTLGALIVKTKVQVGLVVLAATCAAGAWWLARGAQPDRGALSAAAAAIERAADPLVRPHGEVLVDEDSAGDVRSSASASATAAQGAAHAQALRVRRGRVLDLAGDPVAGVGVHDDWREAEEQAAPDAVTDASGYFAFEVAAGASLSHVVARGAGWFTVYSGREAPERGSAEITVIVAPEVRLAGVVVDAAGDPVADAVVAVELDDSERRRLGALTVGAYEISADARTDSLGRFSIERAPSARGVVSARRGAASPAFTPLPRFSRGDLVLRMPDAPSGGLAIRGRVLDELGQPVPDAYVAVAGFGTRSGAEGNFVLEVQIEALSSIGERQTSRALTLVAAAAGRRAARLELPAPHAVEAFVAGRELELRLGAAPLAIRGIVVDTRGEPVPGATVDLVDEELLGTVEEQVGATQVVETLTLEAVLRGGVARAAAGTDTAGAFEIAGLEERAYRLVAHAAQLGARAASPPIPAGARDVRIVLDTSAPGRPVAGVVVDGNGTPVKHATVTTQIALDGFAGEHEGPRVSTDEEGRFTIAALRGRLTGLMVGASGFGPSRLELGEHAAWTGLRIVLRRQRYVQVEATGQAELADRVRFEDEAGRAVSVHVLASRQTSTGSISTWSTLADLSIEAGRSDVAMVEERPLTAVFFQGAEVVARVPVRFSAEGTTILRP
ncbi:MAG: sigma-70 family RNA polymerase sigma factor [Planctomycetes bacterium]|nr:sigma-70 family RNA polymerase sigma factor [Planctomycetota bacterium]